MFFFWHERAGRAHHDVEVEEETRAPAPPASSTRALQRCAHCGGGGAPLDRATRDYFEPRFGRDFGSVRVHTDASADASARAMNSLAYTVGEHVAFRAGYYEPRTTAGRRLLAHELTHTVQQAGAAPAVSPDLADATAESERRADRVADAAVTGAPLPDAGRTPVQVARQPADAGVSDAGASPATAVYGSRADEVIALLDQPDPIAGVGNPRAALDLLESLPMDELVRTVAELDRRGRLDAPLTAPPTPRPHVEAAVSLVRLTHASPAPSTADMAAAGAALGKLESWQQFEALGALVELTGPGNGREVVEGITAMVEAEQPTQPVVAGVTGQVGPGPWAPPGNQPIPFYIGNEAHVAIAAVYVAEHPGDPVFTNFISIGAILMARGINPIAPGLMGLDLDGKPDIANMAMALPIYPHLYEIKPAGSVGLAATEAAEYVAAFVAAGVPMTLGPTGERGTSGVIPAPGGYYAFTSPLPGVITYQYRRGIFVPVPVPVPQEQTAESPAPAVDKSFRERMAEVTGLTGTALTIYLIVSEGSRLFPPRNLIPAP